VSQAEKFCVSFGLLACLMDSYNCKELTGSAGSSEKGVNTIQVADLLQRRKGRKIDQYDG
jgi:hypothetical protein